MNGDRPNPRDLASPACLAREIDPAYFDPLAVDPEQARDVARWRKAERLRLLSDRSALPVATRKAAAQAVAAHLDAALAERLGGLDGVTISAWWPIKSELDLRFWLAGLAARGARAALPRVARKDSPLTFRAWTPDTPMVREVWNIPVPAEGPDILPDITLSPVVGWDPAGYRLGYGGGYFDRTLAAMSPRPLAIGVGLESARIATIYPQPHDVPMQLIVTETGIHRPETK
ncbi:5-formyltetrahydrofolate cyclo-ligase [Sedimentitalea sp. JM2-8]|uniref:5-formyltetrahydrofolate cyclo-ligase n=1 Tax=Sedimentitalea xiamensis TaxID=3050037 RepID=A0ABT7FHI3_9RHOB|nr:5-formyltetrahydrofolate cyclo-ligase [Sedimentitalea xiamensis]MDK3074587.1 5-formyltetrahydrofolate cyclo-ligase [Sedimentitalea xiamensis]